MRTLKRLAGAILLLGTAGSLTGPALAQSGLVAPRVLTQPAPPAPTTAAGATLEGWAIVRYAVLADGTTSDVRVLEILPPAVDTAPVLDAVEQWTFDPATSDGEAADWHNMESVIVFDGAGESAPPSAAFAESYDSIRGLLEVEAYDEALAESEALLGAATVNTELGLALAQRAIAHLGLSDLHSALASLRLATDPRIPSLPAAELLSALQLRFQAEVQLGRRREALETYRRIDHALDSESANPYDQIANQLTAEWETIDALPVAARVGDDPWRITAARRTFTVADVEGEIRGIEVECDLRATRLEFQPNAEWTLPPSWGRCELFVDAEAGTTFTYYAFLARQEPPD